MTRLLLGAVLLGNVGVCLNAYVAEMLAPPTQVRFDSLDYKTTLQWIPPANISSVHYDVQWKIYGELQWLDVDGCQRINKHHCDLSAVISDPREWYYARVHASSKPASKSAWALSPRFSPRWHTKISPPVLKLNITEQGIVVRVKLPQPLVRKMHNDLFYKIYLIHNGTEEEFEMECCWNKLSLKEVKHNEEYCIQGQTIIPFKANGSVRSAKKCVTTL